MEVARRAREATTTMTVQSFFWRRLRVIFGNIIHNENEIWTKDELRRGMVGEGGRIGIYRVGGGTGGFGGGVGLCGSGFA